jgi:hypothetical protein
MITRSKIRTVAVAVALLLAMSVYAQDDEFEPIDLPDNIAEQ